MKRATFSILFFIKRTKLLKDGKVPIFVRITINSRRVEFSLNLSVCTSDWDLSKNFVKGKTNNSKNLKEDLEEIKAKLIYIKKELEFHREMPSPFRIRDVYMNIKRDGDTAAVIEEETVLGVYKEHNKRCKELEEKKFAKNTIKKYNTGFNHVENFIKYKYKRKDMLLSEITPKFIDDFEHYLRFIRSCNNNSTVKYIRNFKTIIILSFNNGLMRINPFANKHYKLDKVIPTSLEEEELEILINKEFTIKRVEVVKDVYLFCCFTGLSYIDVKLLTYDKIEEYNGKIWLKTNREKTDGLSDIPLIQAAINLINKYKDYPFNKASERVFPVYSNQKMNVYLKEIAAVCGINKNLTTHTARHTFATTVMLSNDIPIDIVNNLMAHTNFEMTKHYARPSREHKRKSIEKINNKYIKTTDINFSSYPISNIDLSKNLN